MTQYPARYKGQDQTFRGALGYAQPLHDDVYRFVDNSGRVTFATQAELSIEEPKRQREPLSGRAIGGAVLAIAAIGIYSIIGNPGDAARLLAVALVFGVTWWVVRQ